MEKDDLFHCVLKSTKLKLIFSSESDCISELNYYLEGFMTTHPLFNAFYDKIVYPPALWTKQLFYSALRTSDMGNLKLGGNLLNFYSLSSLFREAMWAASQICNDGMFYLNSTINKTHECHKSPPTFFCFSSVYTCIHL